MKYEKVHIFKAVYSNHTIYKTWHWSHPEVNKNNLHSYSLFLSAGSHSIFPCTLITLRDGLSCRLSD